MERVVIDANIAISFANAGEKSTTKDIVKRWLILKEFEVVLSEYIFEEIVKGIQKPYFQRHMTQGEAFAYLKLIRETTIPVTLTTQVVGMASQSKDDPVIATAIDGGAKTILTRDIPFQGRSSLIFEKYGIRVISPEQFLQELGKAHQLQNL